MIKGAYICSSKPCKSNVFQANFDRPKTRLHVTFFRKAKRIQVYGCNQNVTSEWGPPEAYCTWRVSTSAGLRVTNVSERPNQVKCQPSLCAWPWLSSWFCQFRKALCVYNLKDICPLEYGDLALKVLAASVPPGACLICKFRPTQSEILGVEFGILCFNKPSIWFWCRFKSKNHCCRLLYLFEDYSGMLCTIQEIFWRLH